MLLSISIFERFNRAFFVQDRWKLYLEGLRNTIIIAVLAAIIGVTIGVIFAMINYINKKTGKLKALSAIAKFYITIIRGTPVVLQLMILYFIVIVFFTNFFMNLLMKFYTNFVIRGKNVIAEFSYIRYNHYIKEFYRY